MRLKYDFHGGGGFVAMRRVFPFKLPETFGCFRTAAAHILINCDGPAIQPGPRRYTRSWVRDCVIMGAALGKAGLPKALREFLTWYAQFQRDASFVPCVVDRDGVDWLVEHDSHGQFIWGFREVIRESGDPRFLRIMYPRARAAANYLIKLRSQRMSKDYAGGDTIHVEIANTITLPPGGLTIVSPLPDGKQIIIESDGGTHATVDPAGTTVVVTSLPFTADLRLGPLPLKPVPI